MPCVDNQWCDRDQAVVVESTVVTQNGHAVELAEGRVIQRPRPKVVPAGPRAAGQMRNLRIGIGQLNPSFMHRAPGDSRMSSMSRSYAMPALSTCDP